MQFLWLNLQDALRTIAGHLSCSFSKQRRGVVLARQTPFTLRGLLSRWVQVDPVLEQVVVEVCDQETNVATLELPISTGFQTGLDSWTEVIEVSFIAGIDFSIAWQAKLGM